MKICRRHPGLSTRIEHITSFGSSLYQSQIDLNQCSMINLCTSFYKVCGPHNSTLAENLAAEEHQRVKIKGLSRVYQKIGVYLLQVSSLFLGTESGLVFHHVLNNLSSSSVKFLITQMLVYDNSFASIRAKTQSEQEGWGFLHGSSFLAFYLKLKECYF